MLNKVKCYTLGRFFKNEVVKRKIHKQSKSLIIIMAHTIYDRDKGTIRVNTPDR